MFAYIQTKRYLVNIFYPKKTVTYVQHALATKYEVRLYFSRHDVCWLFGKQVKDTFPGLVAFSVYGGSQWLERGDRWRDDPGYQPDIYVGGGRPI